MNERLRRFENEPAFLGEIRARAAGKALDLPLPDRAQHRFRYTDPAGLLPGGTVDESLLRGPSDGAGVAIDLPPDAVKAGVKALPFEEALDKGTHEVADHLGRVAGTSDALLAANLASFSSGAVVVVPAGVEVKTPIRVRHAPVPTGDGALASARTLVVVGRGAGATVIEETEQAQGHRLAVTEALLEDEARLVHGHFVSGGSEAVGFVHSAFRVGRNARLTHIQVDRPDGVLKTEASPILEGRGAHSEGLGLALVGGHGQADFRTVEDHAARDSDSRLTYRSVASGHGQSTFTGLLRIREDAIRSEAYEEARGLLLSRKARAEVIPELEILNNEVKCSHGATVGPLDPEALFYLMSRGFDADEAEAMMVEGFVEPVLSRLPDPALAGQVRDRLRQELGRAA